MLVVNRETDVTFFDDVKEVAGLTLLDDDRSGGDGLQHHSVNEETTLLGRETGKDEVVLQSRVDELNGSIRLGVAGGQIFFVQIDRCRKDVLGALLSNTVVDVDVFLALHLLGRARGGHVAVRGRLRSRGRRRWARRGGRGRGDRWCQLWFRFGRVHVLSRSESKQ